VAQFDVYQNPTAAQREAYPYFVVLQSDQFAPLSTRLVMPLARSAVADDGLPRRLAQRVEVLGEKLRFAPLLCTTLPARLLREPLASLRGESHRIVDALDAVISGV
jgi:toxin CcdB